LAEYHGWRRIADASRVKAITAERHRRPYSDGCAAVDIAFLSGGTRTP
jgi:hypothetical protein